MLGITPFPECDKTKKPTTGSKSRNACLYFWRQCRPEVHGILLLSLQLPQSTELKTKPFHIVATGQNEMKIWEEGAKIYSLLPQMHPIIQTKL